VRTPDRYIELVNAGDSPESASETLNDETRALEALQLLLRTDEGVPADAFGPDDLEFMRGMLESRGDRLVLTRAGRLMANEVSIRLCIPVTNK
jgi:oxygen-independent coproporphyrinogen-3 oxidase